MEPVRYREERDPSSGIAYKFLSNYSSLTFRGMRLFQYADSEEDEQDVYFLDYTPPARDAIHMPKYLVYVLVAALIVITFAYAIVGHLIDDLLHDLADWIFGAEEDPDEKLCSVTGKEEEGEEENDNEGIKEMDVVVQVEKKESTAQHSETELTAPLNKFEQVGYVSALSTWP